MQDLRPSDVLPLSLFTRQGIKLLSSGTRLSETLCRALEASGEPTFVLASTVAEVAEATPDEAPKRAGAGANVVVGRAAPVDVVSTGGVLMLEQGQDVEEHHADALKENNAGTNPPTPADAASANRPWAIRHSELARVRATLLRTADTLVTQKKEAWTKIPRQMKIGLEAVPIALEDHPGWLNADEIQKVRAERVQQVRHIYASLLRGTPTPVGPMREIVEELIALFSRHPRRFASLALSAARKPDYLPDHAYTVASLCVAMSIQMRWARWEVVQAGLAGLLADSGMMLVPQAIRTARRKLDENEINRVRRHTTHSVVLLEAVTDLPEVVALAAYQHHEREDNAGYPAGLGAARIHPIAKLVAVADVYASLSAPRPHRSAMMPYQAMEHVVAISSNGRLDRNAARALVRVCGLFPIGSWVRLSDNTAARVVGVHPEMVDRPIVHRYAGGVAGATVDLSKLKPWELSVLEAIEIDD